MGREERAAIAAEPEISYRLRVGSVLLPHEIQRRARQILPPQHCIPSKRPEIEVRIEERYRLSRSARTIDINRVALASILERGGGELGTRHEVVELGLSRGDVL